MSATLRATVGAHFNEKLQCWNEGAQTRAQFQLTDAITAYVYRGQDQAALFAFATAWYTAGGTQTGYDQGQIQLQAMGSQTGLLDPNGIYRVLVWKQSQGDSEKYCVWKGDLVAEPAAGTAAQSVTPYCSYQDLLNYAPWVKLIQDRDTDQEGFYSQRLQAREWLDWLIVKAWRGGAWGVFGDASRPSSEWSGWGMWRTPLPSPYLQDMLAGGFVPQNNAITITSAGTGYTTAPIVTAPAPPAGGAPLNRSATFIASLNGAGGVGAIVVGDPGRGYAPGSTLTLSFAGGGGSGAAATAKVSAGTLIVRQQVARLCAFKAISLVGTAQIGVNNQYAGFGQYFADRASEELQQYVAELDINGDGLADLAVPMGRTNTIYE